MNAVLHESTLVDGPGGKVFDSVVEHWAKARIDTPLQMTGRLDEIARQIIAIAGVLQGLIITLAKVEEGRPGFLMVVFSGLASVCFIAAISLSARAIHHQSNQLQAGPVFQMLRNADSGAVLEDLNRQIACWCSDAENIARAKRARIDQAMAAFVGGLVALLACFVVNVAFG